MRFIVDAQLPPALARWLASQGHQAEHVADRNIESAADEVIWTFALIHGATIITKDEDFARRNAAAFGKGPKIIWLRCPNMRNRALIAALAPVLPAALAALESGETIVEVM